MLRTKDLQENLLHLIGWEQYYDTSELKISENLTESESGMFFQQIHPLLTLDNIISIAPDFKNVKFPEYKQQNEEQEDDDLIGIEVYDEPQDEEQDGDEEHGYKKGSIVSYDGKLYKALKDITDEPIDDEEAWVETSPFSEWLESKTKASIQKAILRFINEKMVKGATKDLFESRTLFDGTGRLVDTIKNKNNLVGFEIVPIRANGITTKINKIGLQFTEPGEYTIYIMHSSNSEPVYTIKLEKVKRNTIEWFKLDDVFLPYQGQDNDAGGSWYICYFQSELPEDSLAIRKDRDWSKGPCNACSRAEYKAWETWSKYIEVHPFYVNEELIERDEDIPISLWNVENNQYTYDTNYGINLEISISCDLTDFIIRQKHLFQDIIGKQLAIDMLREFAYNSNVRTNRHSINASRTDILYEIDGDSSSMRRSGLSYQLELAYKALTMGTQGLDRVCLPCVNNGVKYRTV